MLRELVAVEGLVEKAAVVTEHLRLDHHAARQAGFDHLHRTTPRLASDSRYWPYPFLARGAARRVRSVSSIQPLVQAISSGQHTRRPCRASTVSMKFEASISDWWVPVSSQA